MAKQPEDANSSDSAADRPPDAELEVLACLWQKGEATAREVREMMADYRPMAHGSTVTLLKRLEAKGLVAHRKAPTGKAFIYEPTRNGKPTYRRVLGDLVKRIFRGNNVEVVTSLLDANPPTPQELERLRKLVDDLSTDTEDPDSP